MVELTDGQMTDHLFTSKTAGVVKKGGPRASRIEADKFKKQSGDDRHLWMLRRLEQQASHVKKWAKRRPDYVGVEDYAVGAEQGAHYIGELGGIARHILWAAGIPFRLHDPSSVKMFGAHDGTAPKEEMELHVIERWGADFGRYNSGKDTKSSEDLADAFVIAMMVWTEYRIKKGFVELSTLHEKEIRVFHRVTKAQPVCLLEREWITE
jgi:Holliday junction resolvasome RuvABC endonuclease subunit